LKLVYSRSVLEVTAKTTKTSDGDDDGGGDVDCNDVVR
jgi:hypothetical protein